MIKSLKLFAACVESLRLAEKNYEIDKTAFNLNIVRRMQEKVDGWINWIHNQQDEELKKNVPPFINRRLSTENSDLLGENVMKELMKSHSPEEVMKFTRLLNGENNNF